LFVAVAVMVCVPSDKDVLNDQVENAVPVFVAGVGVPPSTDILTPVTV
jgi:hypothetical protein